MTSVTPRARFLSVCGALPVVSLLALPGLRPAAAQTVIAPPAANGTVAVVPAGPKRVAASVIIAAAIDTSGNAENAKRAISAANTALQATPGYAPMPPSGYAPLSSGQAAAAFKGLDFSYPFTASDYQAIGKATKAPNALTISVTPAADGTFSAVAELMRTQDGALVGYGKGTSTAGATGDDLLDSAVASAVIALGETARIGGVVISKPAGGLARLSLGTQSGARGGARVEYLGETGQPIAFGTIIDISAGESLATVAPETAFPGLFVNQRIRLVTNPTAARATPTVAEKQDKDYREFERHFAFSFALVGAVYVLAIAD
ncbi:MAG TPA: hypothetical protein VF627_01800 [Abditibacterium sp.]